MAAEVVARAHTRRWIPLGGGPNTPRRSPRPSGIAASRRRLTELIDLAGGRFAFSWSSYAFLFVPATLAVAALEAPTGFRTGQLFAMAFLAVTFALLVGLAFDRSLLRSRAEKRPPLVALAAYWLSAGAALGLVRIVCTLAWTDADPDPLLRLVGSVSGGLIWVPAVAVVQALLDVRRESLEELARVERRIARIHADAETSLEEQVAALTEAVNATVTPHIERLGRQVDAMGGRLSRRQLHELAREIQRVSADVVRLTSHRMVEPGSLDEQPVDRPRILGRVVREVARRPVRQPWISSSMLIVGTGPEIYRTAGLGTALVGIGAVLLATGMLQIVDRLSRDRDERAATWIQWTALLVLVGAVGLLPPFLEGFGDFNAGTELAPVLLFAPLVALGSVMASAAVATRRHHLRLLAELRLRNDELQREADDIRLRADDVRRRLAAVLHGPVQGRLSAASMLLALRLGDRSGGVDGVLAETAELLHGAADDLAELARLPERIPSVRGSLDAMVRDWAGIVDVRWDMGEGVQTVLERNSVLGAAIGEVLVDMVTNAARHGRARTVELELRITASQRHGRRSRSLVVECVNDGLPLPAGHSLGSPGFVQGALRSVQGEWTLREENGRVVSTVRAPVPARRPGTSARTARYV